VTQRNEPKAFMLVLYSIAFARSIMHTPSHPFAEALPAEIATLSMSKQLAYQPYKQIF
jgi:hypothetical protein